MNTILMAVCTYLFLRAAFNFAVGIVQFVVGIVMCIAACSLWALGCCLGVFDVLWRTAFPKT